MSSLPFYLKEIHLLPYDIYKMLLSHNFPCLPQFNRMLNKQQLKCYNASTDAYQQLYMSYTSTNHQTNSKYKQKYYVLLIQVSKRINLYKNSKQQIITLHKFHIVQIIHLHRLFLGHSRPSSQ